ARYRRSGRTGADGFECRRVAADERRRARVDNRTNHWLFCQRCLHHVRIQRQAQRDVSIYGDGCTMKMPRKLWQAGADDRFSSSPKRRQPTKGDGLPPLSSRGQAMIETSLVLVLLLAFLVGTLDCGQFLYFHQALSERARAAARFAAVNPTDRT